MGKKKAQTPQPAEKLNRIKIVLSEKDLNQKFLSDNLDVGRNTVTNWCKNYTQPSLQDLKKIAKLLDVDIRELIVPTKS